MPISASGLKQAMEPLIAAKLQEVFPEVSDYPEQASSARRLAKALADGISEALIPYLLANAQVAPGIAVATAGSPSAQTGVTTATGRLL